MINKTKIEYGDYSWNFFPGCDNSTCAIRQGCWAQRQLKRMKCPECGRGKPHLHPERFNRPFPSKPSRILVNFMGDLFGPWVPEDWRTEAFGRMRAASGHTFLTLTKQPQNLPRDGWPPNVWCGVTATTLLEIMSGMQFLSETQARIKWLSLEPLLEWYNYPNMAKHLKHTGVSWLVIGACTRMKGIPPPKIEWLREIVEAADQAGVKVWVKNNLAALVCDTRLAPSAYELCYRDGKLRQELPE